MNSTSNTIDDLGKSITNDFNLTVNNLVVNKDALIKGDLTVEGNFNITNFDIVNLTAENATIDDLTLTNPLLPSSGGTGLSNLGSAGQVLAVNSTGTGLEYISNTTAVTSVTGSSPIVSSGGLTPDISLSTVPTAKGGTGLTTLGTSGQVLAVNSTGTGLEYVSNTTGSVTSVTGSSPIVSSGGLTPDISLSTVPTVKGGTGLTTIGSAGQVLGVNSTGTGLEYISNTSGSVTSVTASSPLSSTGGQTPNISIPSTTGTGSTVALNNAPSFIGPVNVTGNIICIDGNIGLQAKTTSGQDTSITVTSTKSKVRSSSDMDFEIDNTGQSLNKKIRLIADTVTITNSQYDLSQANSLNVLLPSYLTTSFCDEFLNFTNISNTQNNSSQGIKMYTFGNSGSPRLAMGINSGSSYPYTTSSFFNMTDISGTFNMTTGAGNASFNLGTGSFNVTTATLGNINFTCSGTGAITTQTFGAGSISLGCLGYGSISATTTAGQISFSSGGLFSISSAQYFTVTCPTMNLSGKLNAEGDASFAGKMEVQGDCVFNRQVSVGGELSVQLSLEVQEDAEFNSTVVIADTLSCNKDVNIEKNLSVTGNSTFNGVIETENKVAVGGALVVQGNSEFGGTAKVQGTLSCNKDLTVEGKTFLNGVVDTEGNVLVGKDLSVTGNSTFKGILSTEKKVVVGGELTVQQKAEFYGDLNAKQKVTIEKDLSVTGNSTFNGVLETENKVAVGGDLFVQGKSEFGGTAKVQGTLSCNKDLTVEGKTFLNGVVDTENNVLVGSDLSVSKKLTVTGSSQFYSTVTTTGNTSLGGTLTVGGSTNLSSTLTVAASINGGSLAIIGKGNISGGLDVQGLFGVQGASNLSGALTVQGPTNITGALTVQGATNFTGPSQVQGAVNITGSLSVEGVSTFVGFTNMLGAASVGGLFTAAGAATILGATNCFAGLGVAGGVTINTIGQQCEITGGKIQLFSQLDAIHFVAPQGGINIGGPNIPGDDQVGHVDIITTNNSTAFATGNILLKTNTQGSYTGNGNITLDTTNAYSGDMYIVSKGTLAIGASNAVPSSTPSTPYLIDIDTSALIGNYSWKFPPTIGTLNSILLSGGTSAGLSWLSPGAANTYLQSDGTNLLWVTASSFTDWANPGAIGSTTPNSGSFTSLTASQNIISSQNIVSGVLTLQNGNTSLTVNSPHTITIQGGSGSTVTLPDAQTLVVGFSYEINNNSNSTATINYYNSGTLGTLSQNQLALVTCIGTGSPNGQWDIHVSGTDWAIPGAIGSITPNTGAFTILSASASVSTPLSSAVLNVTNSNSGSASIANFLAPNLVSGGFTVLNFGKSATNGGTAQFSYYHNTTGTEISSSWNFYNEASPYITLKRNNTITTGAAQQIFNGSIQNAFRFITSHTPNQTAFSVESPSLSNGQFVNKWIGVNDLGYNCGLDQFNYTSSQSTSNTYQIGLYAGAQTIYGASSITNTANTIINGSLYASGATLDIPSGNGVYAGMDSASNYGVITLNGPLGANIDFSQAGVDYLARIIYWATGAGPYGANVFNFTAPKMVFNTSTNNSFRHISSSNASQPDAFTIEAPSMLSGSVLRQWTGVSSAAYQCGYQEYAYGGTASANSFTVGLQTGANLKFSYNLATVSQPLSGVTAGFSSLGTTLGAPILTVINTHTGTNSLASFFSPNLATGSSTQINFGRSLATGLSAVLSFTYNTTNNHHSSKWQFYNENPSITLNRNDTISLTAGNIINNVSLNSGFQIASSFTTNHTGATTFSSFLADGNYINRLFGINSSSLNCGYDQFNRVSSGSTSNTYDIGLVGGTFTKYGNSTITLNGNTTISGSSSTYSTGVLNVSSTSTTSSSIATFLSPNLPSGGYQTIMFGKSTSGGSESAAQLTYGYNSTNTSIISSWSFFNIASPAIILQRNDNITLNGITNCNGSSSAFTSALLNVTNSNSGSASIANFLAPNLTGFTVVHVGKSATDGNAVGLYYNHNATATNISSDWKFYGEASPAITLKRNNTITTTAAQQIFNGSIQNAFRFVTSHTPNQTAFSIEIPSLTGGQVANKWIGVNDSPRNCGLDQFNYQSSGSTSNTYQIGLYTGAQTTYGASSITHSADTYINGSLTTNLLNSSSTMSLTAYQDINLTSSTANTNLKAFYSTNFSAQTHYFWNRTTTSVAAILYSSGMPYLPDTGPTLGTINGGLEIKNIATFATNYCIASAANVAYFGFFGLPSGTYPATSYGAIFWNGANTVYATSSDYRLKKNVQPLQNALAAVNQLKPCTYDMLANNQSSYGFLAHEVQEVIPELISGTKDEVDEKGNIVPQQIDYSRFTPYTVAAIQELSKQIQELQKQIALLNQ